jgi:hypothetical protein
MFGKFSNELYELLSNRGFPNMNQTFSTSLEFDQKKHEGI